MAIKPTYKELERKVASLERTVSEYAQIIDNLKIYQDIISSTPDGMAFIDTEYKYVIVNDSYEMYSGRKRDTFPGLTISEYLGEEVFEQVVKPKFDRCLQGETINFQGWFEYPAAGRKYVDVTYSPHRTAGNAISGVIVNTRDITENRMSAERLEQTLAAANAGIWEWDLKTNGNTWSDELWQLYCLDPDDWEPSYEAWRQSIHPADREKVAEQINAAANLGTEFIAEWRVNTPDGRTSWLMSSGVPLQNKSGNVISYRGIVIDVTEQKLTKIQYQEKLQKSEKNYHNLFERMLDGFALHEIICDPSGVPVDYRFLLINPAFENLTGLRAEDLIGKTVLEVMPDTEKHWIETYGKVALQGEPAIFEEYSRVLDKYFEVSAYRPAANHFACIFQDVTPRKIAEKKLKEALEFNQLVIRTSPLGLLVFEESGPCVMTNPAAAQIANASEEQLLQLNFKEMDSYKNTGILADMEKSLRTGKVIQREIHTLNTFGKDVWFDGYITCFEINGERHILYLFLDILEKKMLEKQAGLQNAEYQAIVNSITDAIVLVDIDRRIVRVNRAFESTFGYDLPDIVGKTTQFLYADPDEYLKENEGLHDRDTVDRKRVCQIHYQRKDGSVFPGETVGVPVADVKDGISGYLGVIRDITKRMQTEEELLRQKKLFETMFNTIPDGVVITDTNREIVLANKSMDYTFGYNPDELLGKSTENLYASRDMYRQAGEVVFGEKAGKRGAQYITRYRKKNGLEFIGETFGARLFDENNSWLGNLGIMRDITERVRQEEEGIMLQKQLSQAQKMEAIGALAGGIAHDFNNILGAILGYAEMAHEDCTPDSVLAGDIEKIIIAGNRARDLVRQILAFSRQSEAQRLVLQPAIIVRELLKLLRATLPATIEIKQDIDLKTGLIYADPTQVHQVLMNLCTNAFHAMEETGGNLTISLKKRTLTDLDIADEQKIEAGDYVQLSVGDTGPGIAEEIKSRIFEPYFTTKTVGKGTGMGLAIAHGIISSYGGFIRCESRVGKGTVFDIFIPIVEDHVEVAEKSETSSPVSSRNEHILFVDDEEPLAKMTQTMLERLGYRVTVRMSSLEALATFRNDPGTFDLVITDQTMPGMSGFDLARRMLQIRPRLPVILCTGFSTVITEEKAKSVGIKGFAMKPVSKKEIATLISSVLSDCR